MLDIKVIGFEGERLSSEAGLMDQRFQQDTKGTKSSEQSTQIGEEKGL